MLAIYLRLMSPTGSSDLPPGIGRAALHAPVYMVLQLASGTALCYLNSALANSFPLRNTMLCVARTFLFLPCGSQRQTDLLQFDAKIVHFLGIYLTAVSLDLFVALFSFLILIHFIELRTN